MPRYVALLRAINVGGHVVKMNALRRQFEALGFSGVSTHIASGNVLFTARAGARGAAERRIADSLERALGYAVATFLRTGTEMAVAAAHAPYTDLADTDSLSVGFLARTLTAGERNALRAFENEVDDFALHAGEVYWRSRVRISRSKFTLARFERALGVQATFRNVTTVRAIAALMAGDDG